MLHFDPPALSTLLDYVDAPAQAVLDKTARSVAQRISDETRAELDKVLTRVENIYGSFETFEQNANRGANVEYLNDLKELEEILKDNLKKKKYQQQVTVFIVGFESACSTRLKLIQQVNEFFMDTSAAMSEDVPDEPLDVEDSDKEEALFEELNSQMEESISSCHQLSDRLAEVNKEMVDFLAAYAQSKTNAKPIRTGGGKKKMEKALESARHEMSQLSEKLLRAQEELKEKEDRIQQLYKQMEMKNIEVQKYRTAAESMKKSVMEIDALKETLSKKDAEMRLLQARIDELSIENAENAEVSELGHERAREADAVAKAKMNDLENKLQSKAMAMEETQRDTVDDMMEMQKQFDEQLARVHSEHQQQIEELNRLHTTEIEQLKHGGESTGSHFDENAVTKWMSDDEEVEVYKSKSQSRSGNVKSRLSSTKSKGKGEDKSVSERREGEEEEILEFDDQFPLDDESAWSNVPRHHVVGRFNQYRRLSRSQFDEITGRFELLRKNCEKKVHTLKGQFQEHKARWMNERELLVNAVQSSETHREVAQGFAEKAVTQMESMIEAAESQDSLAGIADPSGRQSVMQARISFLEMANAELEEKLGRTEAFAKNLEAQQTPGRPDTGHRTSSTKSKRVTIAAEATEGASRETSAVSSQLSDAKRTASDARRSLQASRQSMADSRAAVASAAASDPLAMDLDDIGDTEPEDWEDAQRSVGSPQSSLLKIFGSPLEASYDDEASRKDIPLINHPVVQEYVRTYDHMMKFKEKLSGLLQDKELMSHASNLNELEPVSLKSDSSIATQVEEMGKSIVLVLDQTLVLVRHMLTTTDGDYNLSSMQLSGTSESRAASYVTGGQVTTSVSAALGANEEAIAEANRLREELEALKSKYNDLKAHLDESNKKYEEKLNQNTTIMLEMQDTIMNLKKEITSLSEAPGGSESRQEGQEQMTPLSAAAKHEAPVPPAPEVTSLSQAVSAPPLAWYDGRQPSVIFTRLDYERNAKSLKRAVNESRLEKNDYQDALRKMEDYTQIPAHRLAILVKKYVHQRTMQNIQEKAKRHKTLTTEVLQLWNSMEYIEERRQQRYSEIAEYLTQERMRLAQELVDTFESLEERCSIFLIKPVLSLKARDELKEYYAALMEYREKRRQKEAAEAAAAAEQRMRSRSRSGTHPSPDYSRPLSNEAPGLLQGCAIREPKAAPPTTYWSPTTMQKGQGYLSDNLTAINTPRILEMDVNRILLGQNNVSVSLHGMLPPAAATPQLSVRTYISVARPSSQPKITAHFDDKLQPRPPSKSEVQRSESNKVPPSTPLDRNSLSSGGQGGRLSKDLSGQPPLPPITPTPREAAADEEAVDVMKMSDAEEEEEEEGSEVETGREEEEEENEEEEDEGVGGEEKDKEEAVTERSQSVDQEGEAPAKNLSPPPAKSERPSSRSFSASPASYHQSSQVSSRSLTSED